MSLEILTMWDAVGDYSRRKATEAMSNGVKDLIIELKGDAYHVYFDLTFNIGGSEITTKEHCQFTVGHRGVTADNDAAMHEKILHIALTDRIKNIIYGHHFLAGSYENKGL